MAGGGTSHLDLSLYLIARFVGLMEALEVAKTYLIQWHDAGQRPFAALLPGKQTSDALIAKCQEWAGEHYAESAPVTSMIRLSGLAERTFVRTTCSPPPAAISTYAHMAFSSLWYFNETVRNVLAEGTAPPCTQARRATEAIRPRYRPDCRHGTSSPNRGGCRCGRPRSALRQPVKTSVPRYQLVPVATLYSPTALVRFTRNRSLR